MPEGESIHHTAAAMRIALVDKKMVRFDAPQLIGVVPKAGRTIVRVESAGKDLEIEWDDGIILHAHLRRAGFWDLYRKDDIWQRPHREMRALIETAAWTAVCFNAPTVETYPGAGNLSAPVVRTTRSRSVQRSTPTSTGASSCC